MGFWGKSAFGLIAITSIIAITAATPSREVEDRLRAEGFQFVGNFTSATETDGVSTLGGGGSTQSLTIWLSSATANQDEAVRGCWGVGGELVSMLNFLQEGDVRYALNFLGARDPIWTSGYWDQNRYNWYWRTAAQAAVYTNFLPGCDYRANGYGIVFVGDGAGYWCSEFLNNRRRYICSLK